MKRFATTLSNGHTMESSSPHEAQNFQHYDAVQTFALSGKPATAAEFYAATSAGVQAAFDKKNTTHKIVSVQHGATHLGRVTKWVRR